MPSFDSLIARSMSFVVLNDQQTGLRGGDHRHLLHFHHGAVSLYIDVLDESGRGLAGPHGCKLVRHVIHGLFHRGLSFKNNFVGFHMLAR